jgi:hypothetical protein
MYSYLYIIVLLKEGVERTSALTWHTSALTSQILSAYGTFEMAHQRDREFRNPEIHCTYLCARLCGFRQKDAKSWLSEDSNLSRMI